MLVYHLPAYKAFAERICEKNSFDSGVFEHEVFPDGEQYHRIVSACADRDVVLVGSTWNDADTLAMYDLACGLVASGARTIILAIPYYGYSTMERAVRSGEVVKAKTRARLLSSIPQPQRGMRVLLMDLHADGIPHYFEGAARAVHLYAKPVITAAVAELGGPDCVLGSTDAGRAKWVESLAVDMGITPAFVYKQRINGTQTRVTGVNADVKGRNVVIYDDMIRTGGSLLRAAEAYKAAGAATVSAVTTHLVCPGNSLAKIAEAGLLQRIIGTDTHPRAWHLAETAPAGFLEVRTVAQVFGDYLAAIRK